MKDACAAAMEALRETNKFLQESEPWMRKADEDRPYRLEVVRVCLEAVYCVSHFLVAFLPTACTRVFEKLGECNLQRSGRWWWWWWWCCDGSGGAENRMMFAVTANAACTVEEIVPPLCRRQVQSAPHFLKLVTQHLRRCCVNDKTPEATRCPLPLNLLSFPPSSFVFSADSIHSIPFPSSPYSDGQSFRSACWLPVVLVSSSTPSGLPPIPIGSLKTDFTNVPAGTKITVGSILFGMLELPEEAVATDAAAVGTGEQLQTQAAAAPAAAAVANGGSGPATSKPKAKAKAKPAQSGGGGEGAEGDPFSRIEIKVGRITKVGRVNQRHVIPSAWKGAVCQICQRIYQRIEAGR